VTARFGDLPGAFAVMLCPEERVSIAKAYTVAAAPDRGISVWCGSCRFEEARAGRLREVLAVWPLLAAQEVPKMGQFYEHVGQGVWMLREGEI
jgi:hypothetical protein